MFPPWMRLQNCSLEVPAYNPRLQTDIIILFVSKLQLKFYVNILFTMLLVLSCKSWNVVMPWTWLARLLSWAQQFQDPPPILAITAGTCSGHCLGRSRARSDACFDFLSLKPEEDYFHLTSLKYSHKTLCRFFDKNFAVWKLVSWYIQSAEKKAKINKLTNKPKNLPSMNTFPGKVVI